MNDSNLILGKDYYIPEDNALATLVGKITDFEKPYCYLSQLASYGIIFSEDQMKILKVCAFNAVMKKSFHPESTEKRFKQYWHSLRTTYSSSLKSELPTPFSLKTAKTIENDWLDNFDDPDFQDHNRAEGEEIY